MTNNFSNTQPSWSLIFDELKQKESLPSDAKLAKSLGVTRGFICSVRKERKKVSLQLTKKIFSKLGRTFDIESFENLFLPKKYIEHFDNLNILRNTVISRANGHCQLCEMRAPFNFPNGSPYLELHKVIQSPNVNVEFINDYVALCPNCHKKIEISPTPTDINKLLLIIQKYE